MKNLSLRMKLSLVTLLGAVILLVIGIFAVVNLNAVGKNWDTYLETVQKKQQYLSGMRSAMGYGGAIHQFKNYVLRGKPKYFNRYQKKADKIGKLVKGYISVGHLTTIEKNALEKVLEMAKTYRKASFTARNLFNSGKTSKEVDGVIKISDKPYLKALTTLDLELGKATSKNTQALSGLIDNSVKQMIIMIPLFIIVFLAVMYFIAESITKPINKIISTLEESSHQMNSATGQISSASQSLAEGATEQASSTEEISASLEEIASMTKHNADNASATNTLMQESRNLVDKGIGSMNEMVTAMESIKESSGEISKIIKVIEEIAFQTNLLALNAAVEAARAGEHGKGFAVVAEEVRNLAQRSATASKDTAKLIENAVAKANEGGEIVDKMAEALDEISGSTKKSGDLVAEIVSASNEQSSGITEVNSAVNQMDTITQRNAAVAEESASASEELNAQAESVDDAVSKLSQLVKGA